MSNESRAAIEARERRSRGEPETVQVSKRRGTAAKGEPPETEPEPAAPDEEAP
jgi:hypothetical protein